MIIRYLTLGAAWNPLVIILTGIPAVALMWAVLRSLKHLSFIHIFLLGPFLAFVIKMVHWELYQLVTQATVSWLNSSFDVKLYVNKIYEWSLFYYTWIIGYYAIVNLQDEEVSETLQQDHIWIEQNGASQKIYPSEIEWIEAARDYVRLHMQSERTYFIRQTMTKLEQTLNPKIFQRVHRSAIINLSQINKVSHKGGIFQIQLNSGANVRVGRAYKKTTNSKLNDFVK